MKTSGYMPVNGINMYYEIYGQGEMPLVLIHGGGSTIDSTFSKLIPLLLPGFKLIAVELQAHGRTSDRDAPETFEQDADDVAALLKFLRIDKADFLGFSNGGTTTLQIAIRHTELVNKVVIISANYSREGMFTGFFDYMPHATLADMPQLLKEAYLAVTPNEAGLQIMFEKDRDRMVNFEDIPDEMIANLKMPALIISGDKDVVLPEHVLKLSRLIEDAQLVILPGSHGACIGTIEAEPLPHYNLPEITARLIKGFLKG